MTEKIGSSGADSLYGTDGSDLIKGEAGDDLLVGYLGSDTIYGGTGNDKINWLLSQQIGTLPLRSSERHKEARLPHKVARLLRLILDNDIRSLKRPDDRPRTLSVRFQNEYH